ELRHLLRERENARAAAWVALAFGAQEHTLLQTLDQPAELLLESIGRAPGFGRLDRKRRAPHLRARVLPEIVEELREACDEIRFRHQKVDGYVDAERAPDLRQPFADCDDVALAFRLARAQQIRGAHRHDDAVDRLSPAELAQQL